MFSYMNFTQNFSCIKFGAWLSSKQFKTMVTTTLTLKILIFTGISYLTSF